MERWMTKRRVAQTGAVLAIAGFVLIAASGLLGIQAVFYAGVVLLGLGTGLSTVSNLSLMLDMTTTQVGLYIGAGHRQRHVAPDRQRHGRGSP